MPSKAVAGGVAVVGLAIMIGCAVPMSKETNKSSTKYKGLIAGVVIGVLMLVVGIVMFAMSMGGSSNSGSGNNVNSKNTGAAAAIVAQDPLNIATNAAGATETQAAINAEAAEHLLNKAKGAKNKLAELKGIFASMKPK
jgi:flagellar basal body-associated protein FliL